ncbi:hypothetical protein [Halobacteriovorax sp. JY17]|uniref:hypothetical protein n=1 Tax=Halobacteriovorax sp. JY17 TaxID=2014617 RepID=UPI000C41AB12|nr:hypothetical protein [Halobacteriovorax sp. JY17]PIK15934.1 MAG: hypothetical protein CES88_04190 [Halobacteriovorax sp. JY17]
MVKVLLKIILCLGLCLNTFSKGSFIDYSEAFDVFQIVDGISNWKEGTPKEYRDYYEKTFQLTSADKDMLEKYKAIRLKYYKEYPKAQNSIFSESTISADILSRTFARVKSLDQGLLLLKKKKYIEIDDLKELVSVYKHFKKNISVIVKESTILSSEAKRLERILKKSKMTSNIKKLDKFFDLPTSKIIGGRIKLVWWPQTERPSIAFQGGRVILRVNPIKHAEMLDEEFLTQVVVHSLIISQSKTIKENLSKVFLDTCPGIREKGIAKDLWFEVPLIEALSRYYMVSQKLKKKFNPYNIKTESVWVDVYSKYLFGLTQYSVARKSKFDREFISISANYCQNLLKL